MKKIFLLICALVCLWFGSFAQSEIRIVYVDNSKTGQDDALNDKLIANIQTECTQLSEPGKKFILYLSNGVESSFTSRTERISKLVPRLKGDNTAIPNQLYDCRQMRDLLYEMLANYKGRVVFDYYISGNTCSSIQDHPAFLFNLLPREIASIKDIEVTVNINYPLAYKLADAKRVREALSFYNQDDFASLVIFNVNAF